MKKAKNCVTQVKTPKRYMKNKVEAFIQPAGWPDRSSDRKNKSPTTKNLRKRYTSAELKLDSE